MITFSEKFIRYLAEQALCSRKQRILLAVSGGVDSVVMSSLFREAGFSFAMAHVNFGLRGDESDGDALFVKKLALSCRAPFFHTRVNTEKTAQERQVSIQMAARELRYSWLEEIRKQEGFHHIALAHHLQDITETILINLLRGTGITGLHGILPRNGHLIRPLLFAGKAEIMHYAREKKLKWREDSSNAKTDYTRNLLRHKVLPVFEKINPAYEKTFGQNARHFAEAAFLFNQLIESLESGLVKKQKNGEIHLPKDFFAAHPAASTILYELLKKYDFSATVVADILHSLSHQPGGRFYSSTHELVLDRDVMVIQKTEKKAGETVMKEYPDHLEIIHDHFVLSVYPLSMSKKLYQAILSNRDKMLAYADVEKMKLPMAVRTWKKGDVFHPFGMNGKKKVSDFYTDLKLSLTGKERTFLLTDAEKIIWIMGYRMDSRVAVTPETKFCYRFEYSPR